VPRHSPVAGPFCLQARASLIKAARSSVRSVLLDGFVVVADTYPLPDDRWIAAFPAAGLLSYEVAGDLRDLLPLIRDVYANYRRLGGPFKDALPRSVPDPESYLAGQLPAEDRPPSASPSRRVEVGGSFGG
jgi:hypothetical protein